MANPLTAPYGLAAEQYLKASGLYTTVEGRIRRAQSIGQAHQFVASGACEWGLPPPP